MTGSESVTVGILPLGRSTFDMGFAGERLAAMWRALHAAGLAPDEEPALLTDAAATDAALAGFEARGIADILVLQVTFTDAAAIAGIADRFTGSLGIWAVPEPRIGGRLRLNAFCGLNLAAHALGLRDRPFSWLYADPDDADIGEKIGTLLAGGRKAVAPATMPAGPAVTGGHGAAAAARLAGRRIGRIGAHPDGFDTCRYDDAALHALTGVTVEPMALDTLFDRARALPDAATADIRAEAAASLSGLSDVNAAELDRSLRLRGGLEGLRRDGGYDAFAIRCWPETFTEYGGAVCGPVSMLGEKRVPCACEADVYGAVSQLLLQDIAGAPVFLVDLVDLDIADDSGVVWHCGQAPLSMAAPATPPRATIHTNRKMPLLFEFALKPGRVTLARLSQARGRHAMVIGGGEMLDRPMAFTGTSGVLRFDRPAAEIGRDLIGAGIEHHMAIAYGDHRAALRDAAGALGLDILEL